MSNAQYTVANGDRTDNSAFTVPGDEDGGAGDDSFQVEPDNLDKSQHWYIHVDNGWNENAEVTAQGSHFDDSSMDSPADDGTAETVNAGEVGVFDGETGHSYLQVNVNPAANPTSGNLVVTFQTREA